MCFLKILGVGIFFFINESCEAASLESRRRRKDLEMAPLDLLMYSMLALLVFLHS